MSSAAGSLAHDMLLAFRDQQLSDITVQAFNQTFYLHRLILLRSGYFRSLILGQGDWIEKSRQAVTIHFDDPYVTLQSFQRIIHWLYGIDFHYTEGSAPLTFKTTPANSSSGSNSHAGLGVPGGGGQSMTRSASAQYYGQPIVEGGRHGLGLNHFVMDHHPTYSDKTSIAGAGGAGTVSVRYYDNIMLDPSDSIDELLISMYAAASYLNITALMEEICSDIAHRIRDNRGLIHYMEYAWKLNNGKAWDIILAQCFYQFFWSTYKSITLQEMLVSPEMPLAGLVKTLVSESLYVPNEYERYQLVKGIMLRRLGLETEKLMSWVYNYHEQDWFGILKELDDNGTWSYELTSDAFLNNIQDWESTSTAEYEDAVDTDHDWASTTKELRRRSSQISTSLHFEADDDEEDRAATPTAEKVSSSASQPLKQSPLRKRQENADSEEEDAVEQEEDGMEGTATEQPETPVMKEMKEMKATTPQSPVLETTPQSPILDTAMSSPALSALSISSDTLPRHQVRELLIFMYILHHSIHYTHMSFDNLHQILTDGMVLPSRIKDAFWRQHLLRRIAVSTSTTLPYLSAPSTPPLGRYHGAGPAQRERRTPIVSASSRAKMSGSSRPSPVPTSSPPTNSHGLLPIRFSTSLFISRRDLMTDGKHFTSSTFYGGSWWSIQVGNNLNAAGQVGVFLSSAPVPRVVPNAGGGRALGGSGSSHSSFFSALRGDRAGTASAPMRDRRGGGGSTTGGSTQADQGANGDCSSVYSRQRELDCSYRIYMTSNVVEAPQYFAATASNRLEEIRGSDYGHSHNHHHHHHHHHTPTGSSTGANNDIFRPRAVGLGGGLGSSSLPNSPELGSSSFVRTTQKIASEDEMICHDMFKLNEGWGYKKSNYLTRVARYIRDQPPKAAQNPSNVYPPDSTSPQQARAPANGPPPLQHQQQQQQQQALPLQQHVHQQQQQQPGNPLPQVPLHHGQQQHGPLHHQGQGQGQQHQHQQAQQAHAQGVPLHILQQQQQQQQQQPQIPHDHLQNGGHGTQAATHTTNQYTLGPDETEDDGLWIHFVVKVGWSDRKNTPEKAVS
ncbi:Germ cell-less protein-like 1 [Mortierella hygrophila]|uniref:Germ cell-less protein-like 1 n=1 Tax=Mortierella hygrophila TaxID=979708 RepID=A0A9P6K6C1_9FUNG|nr:Germ cell-less protein-like 1 [Mortierella hygrophila]